MSKYNAKKTIIDGIQFDSKMEGDYYLYLKEQQAEGKIKGFKLQPRFTLLESFEKNGKKFRKIEYVADFEIIHNQDVIEIVDVKGVITPEFAIKRKFFEKKYPYILSVVRYVKKFGGWIDDHEWKRRKREEKRAAK